MIEINWKELKSEEVIPKNVLYKISESRVVRLKEEHETNREIVDVEYILKEKQYGIFATEYRNPSASKKGTKTADVLACVVDEEKKEIYSFILDMKRNISAFSDDLLKDGAMVTAIKEVKEFIEQLHHENLHKNAFLLYYYDVGCTEKLEVGIATKRFESEKFLAVADFLEKLEDLPKPSHMQELVWLKFKTNLMPYVSEINVLKDFANRKVSFSGHSYELKVFLYEKLNDSEFVVCVPIKCG